MTSHTTTKRGNGNERFFFSLPLFPIFSYNATGRGRMVKNPGKLTTGVCNYNAVSCFFAICSENAKVSK